MPLIKGSSPKVIGQNISELHSGNTYAKTSAKFGKKKADKQAIAIAYSEARGHALGGVAGLASQAFNPVGVAGAQTGISAAKPFNRGGAAVSVFKGPIVSDVPGRTDKHFTHVPSGAFVIPADIVSGHGEGNTLAGMNTLQKLFKMGPHGQIEHPVKAMGRMKKMAAGGGADSHVGKPVPVKLAGGEIVVPPENVHETMERVAGKSLSLDQAHEAMDEWVINQRKKLRKTLAKLPGPARD